MCNVLQAPPNLSSILFLSIFLWQAAQSNFLCRLLKIPKASVAKRALFLQCSFLKKRALKLRRCTYVAMCCSVLQCVVVCFSVLQCVAVCCSVLQCVAVCCSVLQCVAVCQGLCLQKKHEIVRILQDVAHTLHIRCNVLSMFQCVPVCSRVLGEQNDLYKNRALLHI